MTDEKNKLINGQSFIIFGEDFSRHPHSLEHILRPMFSDNRFIWVETIGLRSPKINFYDLKRIFEKVIKWISPSNKSSPKLAIQKNVTVISPFMIPFNQYEVIRKFNKWMVTKKVNEAIKANNLTSTITIASVPNACDYVGAFNEKLKIYFCVDEFSLWPGLDKELVESLEKKLIANSDLIITTSSGLSLSKFIPGKITSTITHGVDFDHFNIGKNQTNTKKLKICYFGLFDERSNQDILLTISEQIPEFEIHIFGTVVCDIKKLKERKNVLFHGAISYQSLPDAIKEMDVFILPYKKNELTEFINPLKLKEYLSTGRPVIATDLPEVLKLQEYLLIAKTPQEFIEHLKNLAQNKVNYESDKILEYVKNNETWKAKALELTKIIKTNLP